MALTQHYCNPGLNTDNTGTGIGDPWGDVEFLLETATPGTTGNQINIQNGTDEVLAASLQTAFAAGTFAVAESNPLIFRGYTTAANDGGEGGISGGGAVSIMGGAVLDYVSFIDLHLHNVGANPVLDIDNFATVLRCDVENGTAGGILCDAEALIESNYIHNITGVGAETTTGGWICFNSFKNGTNKFTQCISSQNSPRTILRNIMSLDGSSDGIISSQGDYIVGNAIFSDGGTGQGIVATANQLVAAIRNNIVEGFSGSGGVGFDLDDGTCFVKSYGANAAYNNATDYQAPGGFILDDLGDNEVLTASAFTDAAGDDFSPVNTGNIKEGSLPSNIGNGAL